MNRIIVFMLAVLIGGCATATAQPKIPLPKKIPFGTRSLPSTLQPATLGKVVPTAKPTDTLDPLNWLRQFSVTDLQNAENDALRIDAVCTSGTAANATTMALTGCSSTPAVGDVLTATGGTGSLTSPVTITAVGTFSAGAGAITLSSPQTITGAAVTATNPNLAVDIVTAPCWAFLLKLVQASPSASLIQTTPGIASGIQKVFDDEALLLTWFNPGGTFDQFGVACAPMINKINVQVVTGGASIGTAIAGGPGASTALLTGLQTILGGAIALPKL